MTEERTEAGIQYYQLPLMVEQLQKEVKLIPQDQIQALNCINVLLKIMNAYAVWTSDLKKELNKLHALNKSQAEMIRNKQSLIV